MNWKIAHSQHGRVRQMASMLFAGVVGLGVTVLPAYGQAAIVVPSVPADIQVPDGNDVFLVGHAIGTQNYVCLPSDTETKFVLFTPQATLFGDEGDQLTTHFFSPNPFENGTVRATWQDSRDTSAVWGQAVRSSADPDFVAPGAIPWVLLQSVGAQAFGGEESLVATTFVQRLNTTGGVAPASGCDSSADVGKQALVPYSADYFFYKGAD